MAIHIEQSSDPLKLFLAYELISDLNTYYPGFLHWYREKAKPSVLQGNSYLVLAMDAGRIVGVAMSKKSPDETKLRLVRAHPDYQNSGLGIRLIDKSLELLEERRPHCTVCEEMFPLYSRAFVNYYGFRLDEVSKGEYRRGRLEYKFNKV